MTQLTPGLLKPWEPPRNLVTSGPTLGLLRPWEPPQVGPSLGTRLLHAGSQAIGAAIGTFGAVPTALSELTRLIRLPSSVPRELARWGEGVRGFAEETFPGDPRLQGDFWWDTVPEAVGSFGSFILAGSVGSLAGPAGTLAVVGGLAAATGISEQSERLRPFVESGELSPEMANVAAMFGLVPGIIQVFPVMRGVRLLSGKAAGNVAMRTFNKALLSRLRLQVPFISKKATLLALEEAMTEVVGVVGQNAIERFVVNKDRKWLDGVITAGGAGGVAGFLMGVITTSIGLHRGGVQLGKLTKTDAGRRILKAQAIKENLLSDAEATTLGDDVGGLFEVLQARLDDKKVTLQPTVKEQGFSVNQKTAKVSDLLQVERVTPGTKGEAFVRAAETDLQEGRHREVEVTLTEDGPLITDGRSSLEAAKNLGLDTLPVRVIDDRTTKEVGEGFKIVIADDSVTHREKEALGHNPVMINALRDARDAGEQMDELFENEGVARVRLALEEVRKKGYERSPEKLTADIGLRHKIRLRQQRFFQQLRDALRVSGEIGEAGFDKQFVLDHLESEYVARIDEILKKNDDTLQGAKRQVRAKLRRLFKAGKLQDPRGVRKDIRQAFKDLEELGLSHLDAIHILPETVAMGEASVILAELRAEVEGDWRAKPYSEKAKAILDHIETAIDLSKDIKDLVGGDFRKTTKFLKESIKNFPDHIARPLLEKLDTIKTTKQYTQWLKDAKSAGEQYLRATTANAILTLVSRKELTNRKNPNYARIVELIQKTLSPDIKALSKTTGWNPLTRKVVPVKDGLTADEVGRLELADSPERFEAQSEAHKFYNRRWGKLIESGDLTAADVRFLRFLFSSVSARVLSRVSDIITAPAGKSGDFIPATRAIRLGTARRPVEVFTHEFFHLGYYTFLDSTELSTVRSEWKKLHDTDAPSGIRKIPAGSRWTLAHERVAEILSPNASYKDVDYYASRPREFFAEMGAHWFVSKQTSESVFTRIYTKLMRRLLGYSKTLLGSKATEDLIPPGTLKAMERVVSGKPLEGKQGTMGGPLWALLIEGHSADEVGALEDGGHFLPLKPVQDALSEWLVTGKLKIPDRVASKDEELFRYLLMALAIERGKVVKDPSSHDALIARLDSDYLSYRRRSEKAKDLGIAPGEVESAIEVVQEGGKLAIPPSADSQAFLERVNLRVGVLISESDVGGPGVSEDLIDLHNALSQKLQDIVEAKTQIPEAGGEVGLAVKPKPNPITRTETDQPRINRKVLEGRLDELSTSDLRHLLARLRSLVRQGKIEAGLYRKILKWSKAEDREQALGSIVDKKTRSQWRRRVEAPVGMASLLLFPETTTNWLARVSGVRGALSKIFFGNFEKPYSDSKGHQAASRKHARDLALKVYGFDSDNSRQFRKLLSFLQEKLPNGISRSEAMWAFALREDIGRTAAIERDGIGSRGLKFELEESIGHLTEKDKAYVKGLQEHFSQPKQYPWFEKAFALFRLFHGFEAERSPSGYYPSARSVDSNRLAKSLADFAEMTITKSTRTLEARDPNVRTPFALDGGILGAFYKATSNLALYSEIALPMYRAESLMNDAEFRREFINKFGQTKWDHLKDYLRNILGFVGHNPTSFDAMMTWIPHAWLASKITMNVTSAIRQTFSLMTAMGDNILDKSAMLQALSEGSGFNKRVGKAMRENSGIAYMRLVAREYSQAMLVLGERDPTSRLVSLQEEGFILQRVADDWALRVTWRAAEIMAKKRGLKGKERTAFVVEKFETSLIRNQASTSPLYTSPLEVEAKKHPLLRGTLALQRELNRLYNVVSRHVVIAGQNPTRKNLVQAGNAIFWAGMANTTASVGLNVLRAAAFGLPLWSLAQFSQRLLQDLVSRWYVLSDVTQYFVRFGGKGQRYASEELIGPGFSILIDTARTGSALVGMVKAGTTDKDDPARYFRSGPRRGNDKFYRELELATEHGLASVSAVLGLPFWAIWFQAKGLYNWQREDYRLLVAVETEFQRADEGSPTRQRILKTRERINKTHKLRERGIYTDALARSRIIRELRLSEALR